MIILLLILLSVSIIINIILGIKCNKTNKLSNQANLEIDLFLSSIEGEVKRFRKKHMREKKT